MTERVLIVDDEAGVRESFRIMLADEYDVLAVNGGFECLKLIEEGKKFSLVILDLRMPDLDGMEILRRLKKRDSSLPVVILTAVGTHQTVVEALKLGAVDFIAKPADVYRVKEVIKRALAGDRGSLSKSSGISVSAEDLLRESFNEALQVLTEMIALKYPLLARHSKWTAKYAVAIAERMGFSKEQTEVIRQTSLLHDIGKLGVKDCIVEKAEEDLASEEVSELKKHPEIGEKMLDHFKLMHIEQAMIRHHHERYDGTGYPDGLKGEEIPVYARIMSAANVFERLTSDQINREPLSTQRAVEELQKRSGSQFDPKIIDVFVEIIRG